MNEIISLISNYGFPIVMCIYFITKSEKVINSNTEALLKMTEVMSNCKKK